MKRPNRVAVLMGGNSSERSISLKSGRAVALALRQKGYDVIELDLTDEEAHPVYTLEADACFIAMHGGFGEDGRLQKLLQDRGIPYTGSGPMASELAMDKLKSKILFTIHGVRTPPFRILRGSEPEAKWASLAGELGLPVVVKPRAEGSSIGVSIHRSIETLAGGVRAALAFGPAALMEKMIPGRELTVGILGVRALPVVELRPSREFFDYQAKYHDPDTEYIVDPADLDSNLKERVREMAVRAHEALRCEGFSRVDVILSPEGAPHVLEVNTIPGLTERSLLPKAAAAAGIDYPSLCDLIVKSALRPPMAEAA
jgi:D-alanine-D-alanine ligase